MWLAFILIIMVATDASALVTYITRFTEESFSCLISLIFIYEAIRKLLSILDEETKVLLLQKGELPVRNSFSLCSITYINAPNCGVVVSFRRFV